MTRLYAFTMKPLFPSESNHLPIFQPYTWIYASILLVGALLIKRLSARRRNRVSVECWFCQHNFFVNRGKENAFVCENCEQYNGFLSDGSYNKIIEEQFTEHQRPSHEVY